MAMTTLTQVGAFTNDIANQINSNNFSPGATLVAADGALVITPGLYMITKGSIAAVTLPVPALTQNGVVITIASATAFVHVVTASPISTINNGTAAPKTTITFTGGLIGESVTLVAYNGQWTLVAINIATIS